MTSRRRAQPRARGSGGIELGRQRRSGAEGGADMTVRRWHWQQLRRSMGRICGVTVWRGRLQRRLAVRTAAAAPRGRASGG
jgi:translation initiation factor IF-2